MKDFNELEKFWKAPEGGQPIEPEYIPPEPETPKVNPTIEELDEEDQQYVETATSSRFHIKIWWLIPIFVSLSLLVWL